MSEAVSPALDPRSGAAAADGEPSSDRPPLVAVLGNPNAGKSSIFNWLTGLSQKVGNYPGVTVERKEGTFRVGGRDVRVLDLPGTYSLAAHSPDELVAVDVLLGRIAGGGRPDLVVHVADASNIERNLYLFSQIRELGVPVVLVLNMADIAKRRGMRIDTAELATRLGVPVVLTEGHKGDGISAVREVIETALAGPARAEAVEIAPAHFYAQARELLAGLGPEDERRLGWKPHPFEVLRAIVDRAGSAERRLVEGIGAEFERALEAAREAIDGDGPLAAQEARIRHAWVREHVSPCLEEVRPPGARMSERIDRILTHRVFGLAIFAAVMLVLFQSIFSWASPLMDLIDGAAAALGEAVAAALPEGVFSSLLVDGVIGGAGAVVIFLPQILILFLFIGLLEDCGYMARAAFLMDRLMAWCGLSGKSFIPMLSGFACAVPGIMAARVIESRRDRLTTILVTPLMTCSARLPIYAILIGTFIPNTALLGGVIGLQAATLFALYALGVVVAVIVAWVLKKTILRGAAPPFVMELPAYKMPSLRHIVIRLFERARAFVVDAGTIILAISVIVWALAYFPHSDEVGAPFASERQGVETEIAALAEGDAGRRAELGARLADIDRREAGEYLRQSILGVIGRTVEPVFEPLGWDWRISMAAIASFPAREVIVATLGTIYNLGDDADEESAGLRARLKSARRDDNSELVFSIPVALSVLVFFALCCQCGATLATIRRETNSWWWAWFTFGYMTTLAWIGAFITYQLGMRI